MADPIPDNFLALEPECSDYRTAAFAVLPVPYEATASFRGGTREGPRAVIAASQHLEDFDEELGGEFTAAGIATLPALAPDARGPEQMHRAVYSAARKVVRDGKFPLGLGGEHGISSALVRAVKARHRRLSVLQIDAHADLRDRYGGSPFSHACVMRRVHELGVKIVPVGVRSFSTEEQRYMQRHGIAPLTARRCMESDDWLDEAVDRLGETVYVTVDIDGFDPALAPGTGTPEPGGLDWYQVTSLLRAVAEERRIVGADIVEVAPVPGQVVTENLAARLAYKLICYAQIEH